LPRRSRFVGFAIGCSIWEDAIAAHRRGELDDASVVTVLSQEYLRYANLYRTSDPELVGREH
jgi:myo-inositol catabolism protein IolC